MSDEHNIIPYETLKTSLDQAKAEMEAASAAFYAAVQNEDLPLLIKIALNNFDAAYATVTARTNAMVREYGHLAEVTQNVQNQRDEINQKYESLKRQVNQLKKLNLDDDGHPGDKPKTKNDSDKPNDPSNKGKKRKK